MPDPAAHERQALDYLRAEFGDDAPERLVFIARFDERLLEGEGETSIFSFSASRGGNPPESFFVAAGETEPNYYPAWNLSSEEIYYLHLGTRFMLVVGIQQVPVDRLPSSLDADLRRELERIAPGEPVSDIAPVAAFGFEDQVHAVCRLRVADEDVYVLTGDLPLGIYRYVELPPHVVYRLHLGNVIRSEASDEA